MEPKLTRYAFKAMGSFCEIQLFDASRVSGKQLARKLSREVARLEAKYSRFKSASLLSQINLAAGNAQGLAVDAETVSLLEHAKSCFETSGGLFDITAGVLNTLWDFKQARVPSEEQIEEALCRVGFDRLSWQDSCLHLPEGMQIDFGGIVKEYAADSVARLARELGVDAGLVNLGGDFSVIGAQPDRRPWPVGIQGPEHAQDVIAGIALSAGGLASSGDYERYFLHEGKRYSHILNPKTGWPCAGLRAVSVAANLCTVAGSVATIAMLKEEQEAKEWLAESGLPYVWVDSQAKVESSGLSEQV